jgi:hypothetical protein
MAQMWFAFLGCIWFVTLFTPCRSFSYQQALDEFNSQPFIPNMRYYIDRYLFPYFYSSENPLNPFSRFQCSSLFQKQIDDYRNYSRTWPPPRNIPDELYDQFTFLNEFPVFDQYFAEENDIRSMVWNSELVESFRTRESTCGPYTSPICEELVKDFQPLIRGKRGLIVGSLTPWAEGLLFKYNVSELITVEYTPISTDYPNLTVISPAQLADQYLNGLWEPVDFIFSFSSIEHDGLGRYGDRINPWGDVETMARLHCLLHDDGFMFLSVPTGRDTIVWNAHRIYGRYRLRVLFQDWWALRDCYSTANASSNLTLLLYAEDKVNKGYRYHETVWVLQKKIIT